MWSMYVTRIVFRFVLFVTKVFFSRSLQNLLQYIAIVVINAIVDPWLLLPAAVMTILFYFMRVVYVNTGRCFKRIEAKSLFMKILLGSLFGYKMLHFQVEVQYSRT